MNFPINGNYRRVSLDCTLLNRCNDADLMFPIKDGLSLVIIRLSFNFILPSLLANALNIQLTVLYNQKWSPDMFPISQGTYTSTIRGSQYNRFFLNIH